MEWVTIASGPQKINHVDSTHKIPLINFYKNEANDYILYTVWFLWAEYQLSTVFSLAKTDQLGFVPK